MELPQALALLNDQVKKGIMACNRRICQAPSFSQSDEDDCCGPIRHINLKIEAMTAICSVGLDMIAIPADTPDLTIAAMIADEAAIGVINQKTTAVRSFLMGKKVMLYSRRTSNPFRYEGHLRQLTYCPWYQIPFPVHSFKN